MITKFRIYRELGDEDYELLQALLGRRSTTIAAAGAWLRERGYNFSRSSVARYVKHHRERSRVGRRDLIKGMSDEQLRGVIRRAADLCGGIELTRLARIMLIYAPKAIRRPRKRASTGISVG